MATPNTKQDVFDRAMKVAEAHDGSPLGDLGVAIAAEFARQIAFDAQRAAGNATAATSSSSPPPTTSVHSPSSTSGGSAAGGGAGNA